MADYDLKSITADTDGPSADTELLFGSPDQSTGTPKPYSFAGIKTWIKSWIAKADVALGSVTNDAQTKASVVPNTAPSAGQLLVGNSGGTAYAPVTLTGGVTITSAGVTTAVGRSKKIAFTRDLSAAGADVAYTGVGFKPSKILFIGTTTTHMSIGFSDSAKGSATVNTDAAGTGWDFSTAGILTLVSSGNYQNAIVKSYDSDGFTLTWGKTGSPTGTGNYYALCLE